MVEINRLDLTRLAEDLSKAAGGAEEATQRLLELAGNEIAAEAQNLVPVRTGKLRQSIAVTSGPLRVTVAATAPYGGFVEYGTGTRGEFPTGMYTIRPKNARLLRFKVGGQTVFARSVQHPGIRPQPYIRPAAQRWVDSLGSRAADVGVQLIMGRDQRGP